MRLRKIVGDEVARLQSLQDTIFRRRLADLCSRLLPFREHRLNRRLRFQSYIDFEKFCQASYDAAKRFQVHLFLDGFNPNDIHQGRLRCNASQERDVTTWNDRRAWRLLVSLRHRMLVRQRQAGGQVVLTLLQIRMRVGSAASPCSLHITA